MRSRFLLPAIIIACVLIVFIANAARYIINTGTGANTGTGDTLLVAFNKINSNFAELYDVAVTNGGSGAGNGMVKSGTNLHFATDAAYTAGLVPFASSTSAMGFDSDLSWDSSLNKLTFGAATVDYNGSQFTIAIPGGSGIVSPFFRVSNLSALNASSGTQVYYNIAPSFSQSGTAGYTVLRINPSESSLGSGTHLLADFMVGGVSKSSIENSGALTLSGATNKLTISNDTLLLDGVAVGTSTSTNIYNNIVTTNLTVLNQLTVSNIYTTTMTVVSNLFVNYLYTVNGSHNTLYITNSIQSGSLRTNLLAVSSTGLLTNANYGTGISWDPATLTISSTATGGGSGSVWMPNTALSYSGGTNLTIDGSGGTNFYVLLTNTAFFTTPANIPASKSSNTTFTVYFQQDATGTRLVSWTNASFFFPGGNTNQFQPLTNASAMSSVTFTMSPFTNGVFLGDYGTLY